MFRPEVFEGLARGFRGRCPACGQGALLTRYLKVASPCARCGHDNAQYPADDAPPYFTILIVGHFVIAPLLFLPFIWTWPVGAVVAIALPLVMVATLLLLPRVKGAVIGAHWAIHRLEGVVPGAADPDHSI